MTFEIKELMKEMNLSEEQAGQLTGLQQKIDDAIVIDINKEKNGLLTKNQELIDKLKTAKGNQLPDGFDMDGYTDYVENKDQIEATRIKAEEDKLVSEQNWQKLKNDMVNSHEAAIQKTSRDSHKQINSLRKALDSELIENIALKEIEKEKGSSTLLMPHIKQSMSTFQDDRGNFGVKIIDGLGKDRLSTETGNPMSVAELVAEFKANQDFAGAFPMQNQGSGSNINVGGKDYNSTNNPFDKSGKNYSLTEQAKLAKSNPTLAKALREQA